MYPIKQKALQKIQKAQYLYVAELSEYKPFFVKNKFLVFTKLVKGVYIQEAQKFSENHF